LPLASQGFQTRQEGEPGKGNDWQSRQTTKEKKGNGKNGLEAAANFL